MPYPVLPPTSPVIELSQPEEISHPLPSSTAVLPAEPAQLTSGSGVAPVPTPPERFAPERSPASVEWSTVSDAANTGASDAALLGAPVELNPPQSALSSQQEVAITYGVTSEDLFSTASDSASPAAIAPSTATRTEAAASAVSPSSSPAIASPTLVTEREAAERAAPSAFPATVPPSITSQREAVANGASSALPAIASQAGVGEVASETVGNESISNSVVAGATAAESPLSLFQRQISFRYLSELAGRSPQRTRSPILESLRLNIFAQEAESELAQLPELEPQPLPPLDSAPLPPDESGEPIDPESLPDRLPDSDSTQPSGETLVIPDELPPLPESLSEEVELEEGEPQEGEPSDSPQMNGEEQEPPVDGVSPDQIPTDGEPFLLDPSGTGEVIELSADRQRFDQIQQVFVAEGSVEMRFRRAVLTSDRLRVNLLNRIAVAEGNVTLVSGQQEFRGERFVYNFVQERGDILNASGEIFLPSAGDDFSATLPTDASAGAQEPLRGDLISAEQPEVQPDETGAVTGVDDSGALPDVDTQPDLDSTPTVEDEDEDEIPTDASDAINSEADEDSDAPVSSPGGLSVTLGSGNARRGGTGGEVRRIRFEADEVEFTPDGWVATNVRITNDPFSPPELELRADTATFTRLSPTRSEIRARRPRIVFDQGLSIPYFQNRVILDDRERRPGLVQFGFDEEDRGGFFVESNFEYALSPQVELSLRPQILLQRAYDNGFNLTDPANYGLIGELNVQFSPTTVLRGNAVFTSLDLDELQTQFRGSLRLQQRLFNHTLTAEYSYRDRLFNGSLGFQTVQRSLGLVLTSPTYELGNTGINLSYQTGVQLISANTDRRNLILASDGGNPIELTRYQAGVALRRGFLLWQGEPLPPTATEGLRYTPNPVVPYVSLVAGLRGVFSAYSNGDTQQVYTASLGVRGQFGHFSRPFFDYTGFNLTYSQNIRDGESPFRFDRVVDDRVISGGIIQQLYGPFRVGFQTSLSLDRDREIQTEYILEYSRRTYAITLRVNPRREQASLGLRISDFNWNIDPEPFGGDESGTVDGGVRRRND
ncbi:DUF3769 domain-containing protein [Leptolyngbya sp. FACHB-671]|uniref:DUF3769 domain-containing protein n=1 Tax=Leptolyngbya sp. FACHB-671 TaxID=2692812 RepID=UPI001686BD54|nr:DUF3769 domain-containing protein [Leptolyngbya sp. FACHB-671]MBD2067300.1 DUF3769 domain-containing protein [Leptolyngbya sp. FACHB-671]